MIRNVVQKAHFNQLRLLAAVMFGIAWCYQVSAEDVDSVSTAPYTYLWEDLDSNAAHASGFDTTGTYTVTIVDAPTRISKDHQPRELRYFDQQKIDEFSSDPEFIYEREQLGVGLFEALSRWFSDLFKESSLDLHIPPIAFEIFLYLLIVFAVVMIIISVFRDGISSIVYSKDNKIVNPEFSSLENPDSVADWDTLVEEAVKAENYRLAVRFLYLLSLQKLAQSGVVTWKKDKTNHQYINEIQTEQLRELFGSLTRTYEYVWFGGFDANPKDYNFVLEHHQRLVSSLS